MKRLVIFGCGGHARSVADVALSSGILELLFVDRNARPAERVLGFPVITDAEFASLHMRKPSVIVALGDNREREQVFDGLVKSGFSAIALVAHDAHRGVGVAIGVGSFVGSGAHLGPEASIGQNTIINTRAVIEHGARVEAHSHVSVNATLAGFVHIGERVMIGVGATVIDRVSICSETVVGAGSVVVEDIVEPGTYVGIPARRIRS
jgi:UDP-N-acetylbacillosamine N-acetyltransferase